VLPVTSVAAGVLIDLLVLAFVCSLVIALLSRGDAGNHRMGWGLVLAIVINAAICSTAKLTDAQTYVPKPGILVGAILVGVWFTRHLKPALFQKVIHGFRIALLLTGLCIVWMAPELLVAALHHQKADTVSFRRERAAATTAHSARRIIWILFDELSYAQTFESNNTLVALPNFHRLAEESISFSHLIPPGYYTAKVVPSLMIGRQVTDLRSTLDGYAIIKTVDNSRWHPLDAQQTIFADARRDGWSTGIAGWSNPYCRLLASVLDSCYWLPDQFTPAEMYSHMSGQRSALQNAVAPVAKSIRRLRPSQDPNSGDFHVRDAEGVLAPAEALIRDEQIRFVFIHLGVPHPPGVYDRRMQKLRGGGSYLDNLALADVDLGSLLQAIASTRSAANTTIVICSDHSWRIPMWRNSAGWTNEDEQLAKGGFDPRPVLLVHFPGEEQGSAISEPVDSLVMHEILQETLRGSIRVQKDFVVWRSTHHLY
jgi:hypothetical protein